MKYKELDLRKLMEVADLDFAHYTYTNGDCSCCFGPLYMDAKYWASEERRQAAMETDAEYSYILFKNAENGSGEVCGEDTIECPVYLTWAFTSDEQKELALNELQRQLGSQYKVNAPRSKFRCIEITKN